MIHLNQSPPLLESSSLPRQDTFVHLYICTFNGTEYSDLFRFGVGILPGLAREELRITIWHLAFRHNSSVIYCKVHTYFGLDLEIANSYYFFCLFAFEVFIVSLSCSLYKPVLLAY